MTLCHKPPLTVTSHPCISSAVVLLDFRCHCEELFSPVLHVEFYKLTLRVSSSDLLRVCSLVLTTLPHHLPRRVNLEKGRRIHLSPITQSSQPFFPKL